MSGETARVGGEWKHTGVQEFSRRRCRSADRAMSASRTEHVMVFNKWRIPMFPWEGAHDEVMVSIGNCEDEHAGPSLCSVACRRRRCLKRCPTTAKGGRCCSESHSPKLTRTDENKLNTLVQGSLRKATSPLLHMHCKVPQLPYLIFI